MTLDELLGLGGDDFIRGAYLALLRRHVDEGGLHHYRQRMRSGQTKASVLLDLSRSPEARRAGVDATVSALAPKVLLRAAIRRSLGRNPHPGEERRHLGSLKGVGRREDVVAETWQSPEALAMRPEDALFRSELEALLQKERIARSWRTRLNPFARWDRAIERMDDRLREAAANALATRLRLEALEGTLLTAWSTRTASGVELAGTRAGAVHEQALSSHARKIFQHLRDRLVERSVNAR